MKTEDSIFKYNLFENYLELFGVSALTNDSFFREIKKVNFSPIFYPKMTTKIPQNRQDIEYTTIP